MLRSTRTDVFRAEAGGMRVAGIDIDRVVIGAGAKVRRDGETALGLLPGVDGSAAARRAGRCARKEPPAGTSEDEQERDEQDDREEGEDGEDAQAAADGGLARRSLGRG